MPLDLTPLERAAHRAGLPGLRARSVPRERRRDRWFDWEDGELLVSEQVLDRCPPAEASALLIDVIVERRRRCRAWRLALAGALLAAGAAALVQAGSAWGRTTAAEEFHVDWWALALSAGFTALVVLPVLASVLFAAARFAADDEAVRLLGDPVPLVRGFNLMDQDEIRVRDWSLRARPDLHARAERLARLHRLREAPHPAPASPGPPAGDD